jgi:hypothetical protein
MTELNKFLNDWREIGVQGRSLTNIEISKVVVDWLKQKYQKIEGTQFANPVAKLSRLYQIDELITEIQIQSQSKNKEGKE